VDAMNPPADKGEVTDPDAMFLQARAASDLMKTLSNETRLLILCLLSSGEMTVSQLEGKLKIPQASLSQQLARLRSEKLVGTRRDGRSIHYFVADARVASVVGTLYQLYCTV
jgi:DNA-binding transcriptional ArsR family regulator